MITVKMEITSYYIDDKNTLHTFCNDLKHITIADVHTEAQAEKIISELNNENYELRN